MSVTQFTNQFLFPPPKKSKILNMISLWYTNSRKRKMNKLSEIRFLSRDNNIADLQTAKSSSLKCYQVPNLMTQMYGSWLTVSFTENVLHKPVIFQKGPLVFLDTKLASVNNWWIQVLRDIGIGVPSHLVTGHFSTMRFSLNSFYFSWFTEFAEFSENHLGKIPNNL